MDTLDGSGRPLDRPRDLTDDYFSTGAIVNRGGHASLRGSLAAISRNAVFDAARRLSECVRIVKREQFVGIDYDGRHTHLWFLPTTVLNGEVIDLFAGIRDAVKTEPPPNGLTNEWVISVDLSPYHTSPSSLWKPEAFADIFPWMNRGHFYSPEIANDDLWRWHVAYGQAVPGLTTGGNMTAESLDAYTYGRLSSTWMGRTRINQIVCADSVCEDARRGFYKSCPIYKPPLAVVSCETIPVDGHELVRLTLDGRLHNTHGETGGAPDTFARDRGTWTRSTIAAEPWRSDENGLRLYLIHLDTGYNPTAIVGDNAANSAAPLLPDNPFASIFPAFFMVKLIPRPGHGTPLWHDVWPQVELYARAMCEGYVDPQSTIARSGCAKADEGLPSEECTSDPHGLYEYTFESACLAAFGQRWFPSIGTAATSQTRAAQVRPDAPQGFGPLPTLRALAEQFNAFASFFDLLRYVRVELPLELEMRSADASAGRDFAPQWGSASGEACYHDGTAAPPVPDMESSGWLDLAGSLASYASAELANHRYLYDVRGYASLTDFGWYLSRTDAEWRVKPDQDILYAIPERWRDQVNVHLCLYGSLETVTVAPRVGGPNEYQCGDPTCTDVLVWNDTFNSEGAPALYAPSSTICQDIGRITTRTCECTLSAGMWISAPNPPPCPNVFWDRDPVSVCTVGAATYRTFTPFADGYMCLLVPFADEIGA